MATVIKGEEVATIVKKLCWQANFDLNPQVQKLFEKAYKEGKNSPSAREVLRQLIANAQVAREKKIPLCQDCGHLDVFVEVGVGVSLDEPLEEVIQRGVSEAYKEGYLRQSILSHPLKRSEFEENSLAQIWYEFDKGSELKITVMPKGAGSDNASHLGMLRPTVSEDELISFIVEKVSVSGINACPPLFIGIGLGGAFDSAPLLSKKALLHSFDKSPLDQDLVSLEERILKEVNSLGMGPGGLGGESTALKVSVLTAPTHIASLPVAVNMGCNSLRYASAVVS